MTRLLLISFIFLMSCTHNVSNQFQQPKFIKYNLGSKLHLSHKATKIVLVGGCFDILHFGHVQFLKLAKLQGHHLVVALEPDSRIMQKRKRAVHNQEQRSIMIAPYADTVLLLGKLQGFDDYQQLVWDVKPDIIAVTQDDPQIANKTKQALSVGAKLVVITKRIDSFSSSNIYNLFIQEQ